MTPGPTKSELRTRVRKTRAARSEQELATAAVGFRDAVLAVPEIEAATTIAAYVGVGTEPGTLPLLDALLGRGVRVLLPIVQTDGTLDWAGYEGTGTLAAAARGLLEPTGGRLGPGAVGRAEVIIVPALAVDRHGRRLGRGGGAYDRALALLERPRPVIALVFGDELVDEVPVEAWDVPVSVALTPEGIAVRVS